MSFPFVLPIPWVSPSDAFLCWADDPYVAWLDSNGPIGARSRFSYLAVEPFETVIVAAGEAGPLDGLEAVLRAYREPPLGMPFPFTGGAVGFLGYEVGAGLDRAPRQDGGALGVPDAVFGFYDVVLVFDREERRAWLCSSGLPERESGAREGRAARRADVVRTRLARGGRGAAEPAALLWRQEVSRAEHEARVGRAIGYIGAGDISQANITARFLADRRGARAADIHLALRRENPAPYGAFLGCGADLTIASVSPERFLGVSAAGAIEARPIKGTRARGRDAEEDLALRDELAASGKDLAENLMIVDLLRNDIGRVARLGSVSVPELARVESFAHVHHLVSSVSGALRTGLSAVDVVRATFPGGSITGAPKLRAMEIIHALEGVARGPYCGAIGWFGFDGAMDSNIAIRTLTITPDLVVAQAGGGIVADSDPGAEYEEMMVKIRPLLRALGDMDF